MFCLGSGCGGWRGAAWRPRLFASRVAAGFPSPAEDYVEGSLDLNDFVRHPAATFFLRVAGDSMTGAGIFDGDLLIVDRSLRPRDGSVVVACLHGEFTVKRLRGGPGAWHLVPDNPAYRQIALPEDAEIWGVVTNSVRDHER